MEEKKLVWRAGCLIIHGFGGDFEEIRYLAEYLKAKEYYVLCPSLKGHTGRRKDMIGVKYTDWISSVEGDFEKIRQYCGKTFVIGFSMGGLIGISLCGKYDIDALVTINTPIYYWDFKNIFKNIARGIKNKDYSDINRYTTGLRKYPLSSCYNFTKFIKMTKPKLNRVECPVFVAQSIDDDTVKKKSAEYIFDRVSSKNKRLSYYENAGHVILKSFRARKVSTDIEKFLLEVLNG